MIDFLPNEHNIKPTSNDLLYSQVSVDLNPHHKASFRRYQLTTDQCAKRVSKY